MTRARFTANTRVQRLSRALGLVSAAALIVATRAASAQVDVFPPLDNVMLLVDTSGSMEFQIDGTAVTCNAGNSAQTNHRSRWVSVVEALTGTIQNYSCETLSREGAQFKTGEYAFSGVPSYDYKYPVAFHRALSNGCGVRPGSLPTPNAFVYPASPVTFKNYSTGNDCTFNQDSDGILDNFGDVVRFGLMTFDTLTDPGTGHNGTSPNLTTGIAGTWSYVIGNTITGAPIECPATDQEVGARNGAAPPWEGRMVNFGNPDRGALSHLAKRQQIEDVLRATRPFGATPIAGMLKDAEDFFFNDTSADEDPSPATASLKYGPKGDDYVKDGCRDQFIILLTDGQPNLDLRPECEGDPTCPTTDPDCKCPFDKPEDIALRLKDGGVPVYVIGFALESFTLNSATVTCAEVDIDGECDKAANLTNRPLQACCSLQRIAESGQDPDYVPDPDDPDAIQPGDAIFVDSQSTLKSALSQILSVAQPTSSRTQPVLSSAGSNVAGTQRFYSSYQPFEVRPWVGHIERERYDCVDDPSDPLPKQPVALAIDDDKGDDFERNLASGDGPARKFYTWIGGNSDSDPVDSRVTMRPHIGNTDLDGIGTYGAHVAYGTLDPGSPFWTAVPAVAMEMPTAGCPYTDAEDCRDHYLKWLIGGDNGTDELRCKTPGSDDCFLLGDLMHSTPRVVNRPLATLRDETYTKYASLWATRPTTLYASTNDGFLHAFKTFSNDPADATPADQALTKANNELWAFIPPALLPLLDSLYPHTHVRLLDGAPVVKDVVALIDDNSKITFGRTKENAKTGNGTWRTVLVQSFGTNGSGYFALDVTDPVPNDDDPSDTSEGGPRFLWQLTLDDEKKPLFGKGTVTPVITTLFFDSGDGPSEVPVAVLPGGVGDVGDAGPTNDGCLVTEASGFTTALIDPAYPARDRIKCYDDEYKAAQSLTIVRLDTGEIVRTFRRALTDVSAKMKNADVVTVAPLDSPITGQPVAYPSDTGAVADRIFVGDADGRVWKVNVASINPDDWSMGLFFDTYPKSVNGQGSHDFDDGQQIQTPTILSVNDSGELTLAVSTGDQDTAGTATDMTNYVWSLTESISNKKDLLTKVNWYQALTGGERVTGTMSLFAKVLYFSTFTPPPDGNTKVCNSGSSRLWGVDYIVKNGTVDKGGLPVVWTGDDGTPVQFLEFANLVPKNADNPDGANPTVFGVTIAQLPTCSDDVASEDDWIGYGSHTAMTNINPGKFELVVHTGAAGSALPGGKTNVFKKELPTPPALSQIDSWAALLE